MGFGGPKDCLFVLVCAAKTTTGANCMDFMKELLVLSDLSSFDL